MKKRITYAFAVAILLIALFVNIYYEMQYDINIFEHYNNSKELTAEETLWLKEHGKIIYGSDQSSPPLRYIDERNGQYRGLVVDYIRALSIEIKQDITIEPVNNWGDALNSLKNNEKDFFDMIASKERSEKFDFSDPIYSLRGTILTTKYNTDINDISDLVNKKVAIPRGDYAIEFLKENNIDANYVLTSDINEAIELLVNKRVNAIVGDEPVITYLVDNLNVKDDLRLIDHAIYEKDCVLAVQKSEKILLSILNKGIYNLKKKNVMADIQQKWFGMSGSFSKDNTSEKISLLIVSFISVISLLLYLSYSWNNVLKREVKKRTEELYLSRHDLQVTFDGLTHLMIVIDETLDIVNVNEAFCRLVGQGKKQVRGRNCIDYKDILYGHEVGTIISDTFKYSNQYQKEFKYKSKQFEMNTFPLNDNKNNTKKILIMVKDVTKLKISEQQMLQDNKMKAVGVLAAGVAHEIRNPLGLISNYCYILETNVNNDVGRTEKAISVIQSSVDRASKIIDNLLNFSRISSNECVNTNMRSFITNILELERKAFEKNNIEYEIDCYEKLVCCTKQESLKHIVVNLISNAIDAMPDGGAIKIICKKRKDNLVITCSDTGTGINEEELEKVFTPFYTTKSPGEGTGLGLYIVYNEVLKSGGTINVTSELERGTDFHITLPLNRGEFNEIRKQLS